MFVGIEEQRVVLLENREATRVVGPHLWRQRQNAARRQQEEEQEGIAMCAHVGSPSTTTKLISSFWGNRCGTQRHPKENGYGSYLQTGGSRRSCSLRRTRPQGGLCGPRPLDRFPARILPRPAPAHRHRPPG